MVLGSQLANTDCSFPRFPSSAFFKHTSSVCLFICPSVRGRKGSGWLWEGAGRGCRDGTHFMEVGVGRKLWPDSSQPCPPGLRDRTLLRSQGNQCLSPSRERGAALQGEDRSARQRKLGWDGRPRSCSQPARPRASPWPEATPGSSLYGCSRQPTGLFGNPTPMMVLTWQVIGLGCHPGTGWMVSYRHGAG